MSISTSTQATGEPPLIVAYDPTEKKGNRRQLGQNYPSVDLAFREVNKLIETVMQANFVDGYFKASLGECVFTQRIWHIFDGNIEKRVYLLCKNHEPKDLYALTLTIGSFQLNQGESIIDRCNSVIALDRCESILELKQSKYSHKIVRLLIPPEYTAAQMAAVFSKCEVILDKDDRPFFVPIRGILPSKTSNALVRRYRDVFLLNHDKRLRWTFSFIDRDVANIHYDQQLSVFSNAMFFPSKKCSSEAVAFIEELKNKPMEESAEILARTLVVVSVKSDYDIAMVKNQTAQALLDRIYLFPSYPIKEKIHSIQLMLLKNEKLKLKQKITAAYGVYVKVEPLSFPSHIDPRIRVSRFRWAVTLILHGGSMGNHTEGVIEGVNDGYFPNREENAYFMCMVDFTGEKINFAEFSPSMLAFRDRSQTWLVVAEKAKNMLNSIKDQIEHPPAFSIFGSDSFFSKPGEHNCFTWLREELAKADIIHLGKSWKGLLLTIPRDYTRPSSEYFSQLPAQEL